MAIVSLISLVSSLIITLIFTPLVKKFTLKTHACEEVEIDSGHLQRIPYLGGLSIYASFILIALLMAFSLNCLTPEFKGIIIGSIIILFLGLIDDFLQLSPAKKFFGQTIAVIILLCFGVRTKIAAIGLLPNIMLTFLWMFAIINALNLLDIMDALCSGITAIAASAFLIISFISEDIVAAIFCTILIGTTLGFLKYNYPPARIFLGDTGSMFYGFMLGAVAIIIDYAPLERKIALLTPVLILGLPLYDTAFVVWMRLIHGHSVIKKSKDHFALRLLNYGLSKQKTLLFMYSFGIFFAGSALAISKVSNQQGLAILTIVGLICIGAFKKMGSLSPADRKE